MDCMLYDMLQMRIALFNLAKTLKELNIFG